MEKSPTIRDAADKEIIERELSLLSKFNGVCNADLRARLENLSEEEKTTFIFSTHDARVMEKAQRIVTLRDGRIVSDEVRE